MTAPKKQHWLPQFYLRHFAVPGFRRPRNAKIWMWSKDEHEPITTKIKDVCAKEFLYSHIKPDGSRCFRTEKNLQRLETIISRLYFRVAEGYPDLREAPGIKRLLSLFFATLLLRHPDELEGTKETHRMLVTWYEMFPKDARGRPVVPEFEQEGTSFPFDNSHWEEYRDEDENGMVRMFAETIEQNSRSIANQIFQKRWAFLCLDRPRLFTSDFPVVVKHLEQKTFGVGTPGVHMFFPVTPKRMLHMTDPKDDPDGFYPFPVTKATQLNFFTLGNSKQMTLSHEQPDSMLQPLDLYLNDMISSAYRRHSTMTTQRT